MITPGLFTSFVSLYTLLNSLRVFSFTTPMGLFRLRFCLISLTVDITEAAVLRVGFSALIIVARHMIISKLVIRSSRGISKSIQ